MPFKVKLVNMPFASLQVPSIALTQLRSVVRAHYPREVELEIVYANHDFGRILGPDLYDAIASGPMGQNTGLGDWLFRSMAFPEQGDNSHLYLARYEHHFATLQGPARRLLFDSFIKALPRVLDELIDRYRLADADLVGLTSMFFQTLASLALAQRLRLKGSAQVIVMGGANCETSMGVELVNRAPVLDFVFSGHSLVSFPQLLGCLMRGERAACHSIDGVFSRENSRSITAPASAPAAPEWGQSSLRTRLEGIAETGRELDINTDVPLEYDDFLESWWQHVPRTADKPVLTFETSRGCWWGERAHCTFCGLNGSNMAYRAMHPERAFALIDGLVRRYGDSISTLQCVDNILPREYLEQLFPRLRVPEQLSIFYEVMADLSDQDLGILARAGVRRVQPGIEALATSTLKLMRKGSTAFGNIAFLMNCLKHGVTPEWNLLVGFPGERQEIFEMYVRVLPTLFHLPPPTGVFPVRFDRFSPYFTAQEHYGLKLRPYDFYPLCLPFPEDSLMDVAYYFQDATPDAPYIRDVSLWLAPLREILSRWQRLWTAASPKPGLILRDREGSSVVVDTRTGTSRRHALSAREKAVLEATVTPVPEDRLAGADPQAIANLTRRAMLFRERSKVMSIVSPEGSHGGASEDHSPSRLTSSDSSSSAVSA